MSIIWYLKIVMNGRRWGLMKRNSNVEGEQIGTMATSHRHKCEQTCVWYTYLIINMYVLICKISLIIIIYIRILFFEIIYI